MASSWYVRYVKSKYFTRLMLVYTLIIASVFLVLCSIVIHSVEDMLMEKEQKLGEIVLLNAQEYLKANIQMVKVILQQSYLDKYAKEDVYYFLGNAMDSQLYLDKKPAFDNYFFSQFSRSADLVNLYVYKKLDGQIYQYTRSKASDNYDASQFVYPAMLDQVREVGSTIGLYPAHEYDDRNHSMVYTLSIPIKRPGSNENIGMLMADFDPEGFKSELARLHQEIIGTVLALKKNGEVIYDSSGRYYGAAYPHMPLLEQSSARIGRDSYTIQSLHDDDQTTIAAIVPKKLILQKTELLSGTIYGFTFLAIVLCVGLMVISSNAFSRRVRHIVEAMKEIRKGNLSKRLTVGNTRDEIGQIASGFNKMSEELSRYIERVYLSEIEQKNMELQQKNVELKRKGAELAALQAQINPHFLYNTLEAIRMKALIAGDDSVAEMIYMLSSLFRSSVSSKYIVTLEKELDNSRQYMKLFSIRYEGQIEYRVEVDEAILACGMINHILQPLLENYTIHGYRPKADDNRITVQGHIDGPDLVMVIRDNGKGIDPERLAAICSSLDKPAGAQQDNIGLVNVSHRIKIIFGEAYGLELASEFGQGASVRIRLPLLPIKEFREHVQSIDSG